MTYVNPQAQAGKTGIAGPTSVAMVSPSTPSSSTSVTPAGYPAPHSRPTNLKYVREAETPTPSSSSTPVPGVSTAPITTTTIPTMATAKYSSGFRPMVVGRGKGSYYRQPTVTATARAKRGRGTLTYRRMDSLNYVRDPSKDDLDESERLKLEKAREKLKEKRLLLQISKLAGMINRFKAKKAKREARLARKRGRDGNMHFYNSNYLAAKRTAAKELVSKTNAVLPNQVVIRGAIYERTPDGKALRRITSAVSAPSSKRYVLQNAPRIGILTHPSSFTAVATWCFAMPSRRASKRINIVCFSIALGNAISKAKAVLTSTIPRRLPFVASSSRASATIPTACCSTLSTRTRCR